MDNLGDPPWKFFSLVPFLAARHASVFLGPGVVSHVRSRDAGLSSSCMVCPADAAVVELGWLPIRCHLTIICRDTPRRRGAGQDADVSRVSYLLLALPSNPLVLVHPHHL